MHWTYNANFVPSDDLEQGDILLPSDSLKASLKQVHPWFCDQKYYGFMVLTQSCDLVKGRGNPCSAGHISIAPIRLLRQMLPSIASATCKQLVGKYFDANSRGQLLQALDRILNQNENSLGLFYLHKEGELAIGEEMLVTLRISVALKSSVHYNTLRDSRVGTLNAEFQSKLGWMVGNLYSRVGVQDWKKDSDREKEFSALIKEIVGEIDSHGVEFVQSKKLSELIKSKAIDIDGMTEEQFKTLLNKTQGNKYSDIAVAAIERAFETKLGQPLLVKAIRQLRNDPEFVKSVKQGRE